MSFRIRFRILSLALAAVLAAPAANALAAPQPKEGAPLAEPSKSLYWQGHDALGKRDWSSALELFRELEAQLTRSASEPADAAIYWQAYALSQARRTREAGAQIERLRKEYPQSAWLDDAQALASRQAGSADDAPVGTPRRDERESDALAALDALLAGGNARAVPLLQRVITGDHSNRVRSRAIFVLSQIDPVAAEGALDTLLSGTAPARLKAEAIRMIAAAGRPASLDRLLPVYRGSDDAAVKRAVLDALLIGDRSDLLLQVIEAEGDPRRRRSAIEKLGAMDEREALKRLYATRPDVDDRRAVLRALGIAGDRDALLDIARTEKDAKVQAEAIRSVGVTGGKEAAGDLLDLYPRVVDAGAREAVVDALMIAGATEALVTLYRTEKDPAQRRRLLNRISISDSDAALDLIDDALER